MNPVYDLSAPRKPANLSVNSDLLRQAKALDVNLSQVLEKALVEVVAHRRREEWLRKNREAIDAYNEHVARDGLFGDSLRSF